MAHIGTDILALSRLRNLDGRWEDPFFRKTFTPAERDFCLGRPDPLLAFAEAFSAKEAVFKALDLSAEGVRLDAIEILRDDKGRPTVTLRPPLDRLARDRGVSRVDLSISYETDYVLTAALAE